MVFDRKEWYQKNKERRKKQQKEYRNKPEVKARIKIYCKNYNKIYCGKHKEHLNQQKKEYRQNPRVKARNKEYYQKNKTKIRGWGEKYRKRLEVKARIKAYLKEYYRRLEIQIRVKKYYQKHKDRINTRVGKYRTQRKQSDLNYYLLCNLRTALYKTLKNYSKTGKIMSSKKYGINYKAIIEKLKPFPKDIKNYHVDHIIPLSLFDFNNPEHIKKAFVPENLQWLTAEQNIWKKDRLVAPCAFK